MTEEEFQRIKEAEKERLRSLKRLKEALRLLKRRQKMQEALGRMTDEPNRLLDHTSALIQELTAEAALQEARVEIAMDEARTKQKSEDEAESASSSTASTDAAASNKEAASDVDWEEEQRAARADELLNQIRQGMGLGPTTSRPTNTGDTPARTKTARTKITGADDEDASLPDKTIGRMRE